MSVIWPRAMLAAATPAAGAAHAATAAARSVRPGAHGRPDPRELRTALYQHAFNPTYPTGPGSTAAQILGWGAAGIAACQLSRRAGSLRSALEALTYQLDGSRAAANTIIRKRAVLHGALGYAAEAGLLPDNPLDTISWQVPRSSVALDPMVVASPAQVSVPLDAVDRTRPEMTAFFGCLYYAALRPEEAVALRLIRTDGGDCCQAPGGGSADQAKVRSAAARRPTTGQLAAALILLAGDRPGRLL